MEAQVEEAVLAAMAANLNATLPAPSGVRPLPARAYVDPDRYAREAEAVFRSSWIPVARESELAAAGDFVTCDLAGDRIAVVRGEDGAVRALHNVCRHRGAQILRGERGRTDALLCPYHGFRYDLSGALRSAPVPESLPEDARPGAACLPAVATATFGGWRWVHLGEPGSSLEGALGSELLDELANWPLAELDVVTRRTVEADFDWKIGVEAFLEPFHVPTIHTRSAHPLVDFRGMAVRELGAHSRMALPFRASNAYAPDGVLGRISAAAGVEVFPALNRAQRSAHFVYLVFPCTVLMLLPTHLLCLRFLPARVGRCTMHYELLAAPPTDATAREYCASMIPGYDQLLDEDLANLPWIQRGLTDRSFEGSALSGYEARIGSFWAELARRLER